MIRVVRYLLISGAGTGVPIPALAAEPAVISANDIQMLSSRFADPHYRTGNTEIDALSRGQLQQRLTRATAQQLQALKDNPRTSLQIMENLARIGPAASSALPTLIRLLNQSSSTNYYENPSFCDLATVLPKIDPVLRQVGTALGSNLLRVQRDAGKAVCHMCGCALDAIASTRGPAAAAAGGYIVRYMQGGNLKTTYNSQLNKAIAATKPKGIASQAVRHLASGVHPDQKVGMVREMLATLATMSAQDRAAFRSLLQKFSTDDYFRLRAVAMLALGSFGAQEIPRLKAGLADSHVEVRRAAAQGLASMRAAAAPALEPLLMNLDPIRGAATEVSIALTAIGGAAVAANVRKAAPKAEPWASYYEGVARAAAARSSAGLPDLISRHFQVEKYPYHSNLSGQEIRVSYLDSVKPGRGLMYDPGRHRLRIRVGQSVYENPLTTAPVAAQSIVMDRSVSSPWHLLRGVQAGARLTLRVSPTVDPGPFAPTIFDIELMEVCEPKFWTVFRGSGIIGPIIFEIRCAS